MEIQKIWHTLLILALAIAAVSCKDNTNEPLVIDNPSIVGKWEFIAREYNEGVFGSDKRIISEKPNGYYIEYLDNGKIARGNYLTGEYYYDSCTYQISDVSLHKSYYNETYDEKGNHIYCTYQYRFLTKDELRLDKGETNAAVLDIYKGDYFIYRRINN